MHTTTTTAHCDETTRAFGEILTSSDGSRFMVFRIGAARYGDTGVDFIIRTPELLDKIANEAERLCREFVGDVPPLEPLPAPPPLGEIMDMRTLANNLMGVAR